MYLCQTVIFNPWELDKGGDRLRQLDPFISGSFHFQRLLATEDTKLSQILFRGGNKQLHQHQNKTMELFDVSTTSIDLRNQRAGTDQTLTWRLYQLQNQTMENPDL